MGNGYGWRSSCFSLAGEKSGALYLRLEVTAILSIIKLIYVLPTNIHQYIQSHKFLKIHNSSIAHMSISIQ